jgi:hypothetical protein
MNPTVAAAYTNSPAARVQSWSSCSLVGQLFNPTRRSASSEKQSLKNSCMSLVTWSCSTVWRTNTSVIFANSGRRKPSEIRGSGRPVRKNLTFGILDANRPRTDRITGPDSSSLHSSKASTMITVETLESLRGWTISCSIC